MNSIWKRVQNAPPNWNNCTELLYLAQQKSIKGWYISHVATALMLQRKNRAQGKKCKAWWFQSCYLHEKERGKVKGLLKVSLNGERQKFSSWLVCLKNKLNQQAGVDRNWIKPSGLPLKSMNSIFIMFGPLWTTPPPLSIYKERKSMHQCNGISHFSVEETFSVTAVHRGEIRRDRRREEGWERIKWKELVRWSRRHLWSAVKLNPLIPHPLLFPSSLCFLRSWEDIAAVFFQW